MQVNRVMEARYSGVAHVPRRERVRRRHILGRGAVIAVLILVLGLWTGGIAAEHPEGAMPSVQLTVQGDRVSAKITQAPLGAVLAELARQAGLTVYITSSDATQTVSANFEALSLTEGIKRILQERSYTLISAPTFSAEGKPGAQRVVKIRVLSTGEAYTTLTGSQVEEPAGSPPPPALHNADALAQLKRDALEAPDAKTRVAALEALAEQQKEGDNLATVVVPALRDAAPEVRREALRMLDTVVPAEQGLVNYIAEMAQTDASPQLRATALGYLAQIQGSETQSYLQQALQDPDPTVSERAEQLLDFIKAVQNEREDDQAQPEASPQVQPQTK